MFSGRIIATLSLILTLAFGSACGKEETARPPAHFGSLRAMRAISPA